MSVGRELWGATRHWVDQKAWWLMALWGVVMCTAMAALMAWPEYANGSAFRTWTDEEGSESTYYYFVPSLVVYMVWV